MREQGSTIWAKTALLPEGWRHDVLVEIGESGRIRRVQSGQPAQGMCCSVLIPAPANLHSHAFQLAIAGLTETRGAASRDDFWSWRSRMYAFLERGTPEDVEAITAYAQVLMLEAGYARVAEFHYLHHDTNGNAFENVAEMSLRILAAADDTGIGLTLLPVLYQHAGCDGAELSGPQRRFGLSRGLYRQVLEDAERACRQLPGDSNVGIAVHSLRAVSPATMAWAEGLRPEAPFHMHLAEQPAEVAEVKAALGARPVQWVLDNFNVDRRWCLVHCTQMTEAETRALAASGAIAGLCPITEANLGDGPFDGVRYLEQDGLLGIGTDSNVSISLAGELRALEYSQRLRDGSRAALAVGRQPSTGRTLFDAACQGGAYALGHAPTAIAPGSWADLVELNADDPLFAGVAGDALLDTWIFAGGNRLVKNVWAAGRHLVQNHRHVRRDEVARKARRVLGPLRQSGRAT